MAYQTYDPKTGIQTTYNGETAQTGVAKIDRIDATGQATNFQSSAVPANQPVAPVKNEYGSDLTLDSGQVISKTDPNYETYAKQSGVAKPTDQAKGTQAPNLDQASLDIINRAKSQDAAGIADLITSGKEFNEIDAQNFAFFNKDKNWQQYVGGIGGKTNPNYIGATNWATLQQKYTPYQLQKATIRTKNGISWNPAINIAEVPAVDPSVRINEDTKKIADITSSAKSEADKFSNEDAKKTEKPALSDDKTDNEASIMSMLENTYGDSAETIYNDLYNTPEMKSAQKEVSGLKSELDKYDEQMDDLKDDIRKEVEGEASDSYITALATVRGEKILKLKRATQRDYDTALANYNGIKENASNLLQVRTKDADTRYNRLFSMLQLQIQGEGTKFNQEVAIAQLSMQIPEGRSMTVNGETVKGLKENDDLNVVQFTAADGKTYVLGVDKKTGATKYKTLIGTAHVAGSGTADKSVDLNTALYWLSLVKTKDGYDMNSIPADIRKGVVDTISQNKDKLPAPEKSWWERQKEDFSSGTFWNAVNPID